MRRLILALLVFAPLAHAEVTATQQAETFYHWYIGQAAEMKNPLADPNLSKYVESKTYSTLMKAYQADDVDVDYFTKVQDFDDKDWLSHISADREIEDPICTNVYMTFGQTAKKHVVGCFVKEKGRWKIRSVTDLE